MYLFRADATGEKAAVIQLPILPIGLGVGVLLVSVSLLPFAQAAAATPIYFAKNTVSKTVVGYLPRGKDSHIYQFFAKQGQYMSVTLAPRKHFSEFANVGVVTAPNGTQEGGKGGLVYAGCLAESGKYRLRIGRNLMATDGRKAGYQATLTILPVQQSRKLCR